jgi:hypothetical protein
MTFPNKILVFGNNVRIDTISAGGGVVSIEFLEIQDEHLFLPKSYHRRRCGPGGHQPLPRLSPGNSGNALRPFLLHPFNHLPSEGV